VSIPLLTTKLHRPPTRPRERMVARRRLLALLNDGLLWQEGIFGRRLTLLSAPAGFGKTTLLSEWAQAVGGIAPPTAIAWLSLDEEDNDPARFLTYLISALRQVDETLAAGTISALQLPQPPQAQLVMAALINDIALAARPLLLVLDDYHLISAQPIHDALAFLLDHMPANMHLVIATRADPPLPVARLRGRGQLTELRLTDLRFASDEAGELLNRVMGLSLAPDEVMTLTARTEGWAAGLQMAAVSMQGRDRAHTAHFVRAFAGSDRHILDYLVEEVLGHQSRDIQTFLLHTAILDRLTASLCHALLQEPLPLAAGGGEPAALLGVDCQAMLEYLEAANLFLVPLDNERRWFRYHRLFADLLRGRLHLAAGGEKSDLVATLHRRASAWNEQHGSLAEAIEHAFAAGDLERAAELVEGAAEETLGRSQVVTLMRWAERLPTALVRARPGLSLRYAWALLLGGRPFDEVEACLTDLDDGSAGVAPRAAPLLALVAAFQGRMTRAAELARAALAGLAEDDSFLRGMATWTLGLTLLADGEAEAGLRLIEEAARLGRQSGNLMVTIMPLCYTAEVHLRTGQLHQAQAIYTQALELAVDSGGQPLPIAGEALLGLGFVALEWNRLDEAERYFTEGIDLIRQWGEIGAFDGLVALARLRQARGDPDGAREALQQAERLAVRFDVTDLDDLFIAMQQAQLAITQGELAAAARWAEGRNLTPHDAHIMAYETVPAELLDGAARLDYHLNKYEYLVLARLFIAQNQPEQALAVLQPTLTMLERRGRVANVIETLILRAVALAQMPGRLSQALEALEQALSLAEPGGYVRLFLDAGPPLLELLREAARRNIAVGYVRHLLSEAGVALEGLPAPSPASPLVEPITEREMEVLGLLAQGLTNREIADALYVAVSTIKQHLKNIYGKLEVHSRTQAVGRAQELGLL
jgi:LuxR family maltose regulon positive regulatory protein